MFNSLDARRQPVTDPHRFLKRIGLGFLRVVNPNLALNGNFFINQRQYISGATLASGKYGHDMWVAGVNGGDYSFTQNPYGAVVTIASGKTLIQPIEDKSVDGGSYTLSWTGTAKARIGVNATAASGAYAISPIVVNNAPAGKQINLEFSPGTLSKVKLEAGIYVTPFDRINYAEMLVRVERYFQSSHGQNGFGFTSTSVIILVDHLGMLGNPAITSSGSCGLLLVTGTTIAQTVMNISVFNSVQSPNSTQVILGSFPAVITAGSPVMTNPDSTRIFCSADLPYQAGA